MYQAAGEDPSQGDILDDVPHIWVGDQSALRFPEAPTDASATEDPGGSSGTLLAQYRLATAIIITPDCEIDKPHTRTWIVSPVLPMTVLPESARDIVRQGRVFSKYYLPCFGESLPESFADLNHFSAVADSILRLKPRLISLSDVGRRAFYGYVIRWFTRWQLNRLTCPRCGSPYDASEMPVRSP
jgi:hypothetical protein